MAGIEVSPYKSAGYTAERTTRSQVSEQANQAIPTTIRESEEAPDFKVELKTIRRPSVLIFGAFLHQFRQHAPSPVLVSEPPSHLLKLLL
ncbi:hypothetical protein RFN25_04895 [Mesorhizobium abyssinicae]|uniref:Uncharacterized protein n=1 Tax=Mesorhizobium abyssinicae TaxID=1209958 RepID=A0ABU5AGV7_9HYPH|nr:hypothetical protein [Mesorhizobium abyssinicae]MDX8432769.1 hypothetical protein [Mesorhizobium abyssinicae]MDX8536519.1 hypothetical protein [Mesorhizobium abyssinicae]